MIFYEAFLFSVVHVTDCAVSVDNLNRRKWPPSPFSTIERPKKLAFLVRPIKPSASIKSDLNRKTLSQKIQNSKPKVIQETQSNLPQRQEKGNFNHPFLLIKFIPFCYSWRFIFLILTIYFNFEVFWRIISVILLCHK